MDELDNLLEEARVMCVTSGGTDGWVPHVKYAARFAEAIAAKCGMDAEFARKATLFHDIGRLDSSTRGKGGHAHGLAGYNFLKSKGHEDVIRYCLTHSVPNGKDPSGYASTGLSDAEKKFVENYMNSIVYDDMDLLVQLADSVSLMEGYVTVEQRYIDLMMRYGNLPFWLETFKVIIEIKEYFDEKCDMSVYDILPDFMEKSRQFKYTFQKP